jgi:hypothetical protein
VLVQPDTASHLTEPQPPVLPNTVGLLAHTLSSFLWVQRSGGEEDYL